MAQSRLSQMYFITRIHVNCESMRLRSERNPHPQSIVVVQSLFFSSAQWISLGSGVT
jgi:hypothetical protein